MKVLFLMDILVPLPEDMELYLKNEGHKEELRIIQTLRDLNHEVKVCALYDDILPLVKDIEEWKPNLVFNQCEAFKGDRAFESHIPSLLDLLGVTYTGAKPATLQLCKNKALTKEILAYHRIRVPRFVKSSKNRPIKSLKKFVFPAIIKPLDLEASEGISQMSLVYEEKELLDRVAFIHRSLESDAIIEEFIEGRELYVSLMGSKRIELLPPRELHFRELSEGEPLIATYQAKWNEDYRKKWGVHTAFAKAMDASLENKIGNLCKKIYSLFQIKSYGRIDLRLRADGELFFLEANPNPSIHKGEDFAESAKKAGMSYEQLIERIVQLAV